MAFLSADACKSFAETLTVILVSAAEGVLPTHLPTVSAGCEIAVVVWVEDHHEQRFLGAKANIVTDILQCL